MRYMSMFTGVGGFELGIQQAHPDWECIGFSEIDKWANLLLQYRFPEIHNYGDATKINPRELPDFDMLCGGFPCQAFSIAGNRKGFEDTRGTLFFEIARILEVKRPKIVFLENVKGLLNHEQGKTFSTILGTLWELGYDVQWLVLNSKFHGVPQNRERVFIIGSLRGESRPEILPFRENAAEVSGVFGEEAHGSKMESEDLSEDIPQAMRRYRATGISPSLNKDFSPIVCGNINPSKIGMNGNIYSSDGISPTIDTNKGEGKKIICGTVTCFGSTQKHAGVLNNCSTCLSEAMGKGGGHIPIIKRTQIDISGKGHNSQQDRIYETDGVMCCLPNANPDNKLIINTVPKSCAYRTRTYANEEGHIEVREDNIANQLTTANKDSMLILPKTCSCIGANYYKGNASSHLDKNKFEIRPVVENVGRLRRLTPIECERLQGFPDNWTLIPLANGKMMSDTQRYKMMGNAVTTKVISAIASGLSMRRGD